MFSVACTVLEQCFTLFICNFSPSHSICIILKPLYPTSWSQYHLISLCSGVYILAWSTWDFLSMSPRKLTRSDKTCCRISKWIIVECWYNVAPLVFLKESLRSFMQCKNFSNWGALEHPRDLAWENLCSDSGFQVGWMAWGQAAATLSA